MAVDSPRKSRKRVDRLSRDLPLLRNSERSAFKRCRWMWDRSYNDGLEPQTAAPALRFGTLIHQALAAYYIPGDKRGPHPAHSFEVLYESDLKVSYSFGFRDEDGEWQEAGELGMAMLNNYVDTWGADDEWRVLVTEQPFRQLVKLPSGTPFFVYAGVLDGVWLHKPTKQAWIVDHKTAMAIITRHLAMDDQAGGYWTYGVDWLREKGLLGPRRKLTGMLYNFLRKAAPDDRPTNEDGHFLNKDGSVSKVQPSPHFVRHRVFRDEHDRNEVRKRATAEFAEMEAVRAGELEVYKSPSQMHCMGCWVLDACELHETGNDWQEYMKATAKSWHPYAEHEIYIGETAR